MLLPTAIVAGAASGPAPVDVGTRFVPLTEIVVPIISSDRMEGSLHLKLVVAAADEEALARLTKAEPELRAVSLAQAIEFSRLYASVRTPVNAVQLSGDLTEALRGSDPDVARVLIIQVSASI